MLPVAMKAQARPAEVGFVENRVAVHTVSAGPLLEAKKKGIVNQELYV
jgi:hypothetical protein